MQRSRDRVRGAFRFDIVVRTPEPTGRADGFLGSSTVGHGLGVRLRSYESHRGTFGVSGRSTYLASDHLADRHTSADIAGDSEADRAADSASDRASHATSDATSDAASDTDSDAATEPPRHARFEGRDRGRADVRYGRARR